MTTQTRSPYDDIFERLDKNHDGRIEIDELIELLENAGMDLTEKKRVAMARVSLLACPSRPIRRRSPSRTSSHKAVVRRTPRRYLFSNFSILFSNRRKSYV